MRGLLSYCRTLTGGRGALVALAGLASWMPAGQAAARCFGSEDSVVQNAEIATGRNPAAAIVSIAKTIGATDPSNARRIAELYAAQSIAVSMSGGSPKNVNEKARRAAATYGAEDPVNLYLRIEDYGRTKPGAQRKEKLAGILRDYRKLPAGSQARTCRAIDLAFYYSELDKPREAFGFASEAYRNSDNATRSTTRAEAASMLAYLISEGYDFAYARQLRSEALSIWLELGMSDLAANEMVLRGYMELKDHGWRRALADFQASAAQARGYGNRYAVDYALAGVCLAALEGGQTNLAAPACERSYEALSKPAERMAFAVTAMLGRLRVAQGQPGAALALLDPLIASGRGENDPSDWIMALDAQAQALSMLGRNAEAYAVMRRAKSFADDERDNELRSGSIALRARFKTEELESSLALQERTSDGRLRLATAVTVGAVTAVTLLGALIFSLLRHRRRFRRLAMTDPLTGLRNRRSTQAKAAALLRTVGSEPPRASIALLDIDHFKTCNDRFGHDAGDAALASFARAIERCVRPGDVAGRWGGEEFLLMTPGADKNETARIVERIRIEAESEVFENAPGFQLQFSAGIAQLAEAGGRLHDCIKLADRRLYNAKENGRNRTCLEGYEGTQAASETV